MSSFQIRLLFALTCLFAISSSVVKAQEGPTQDEPVQEAEERHPFPQRIAAPDFPADMTWINTGGPVRMRDLRGKFVILDFWTYCCINCHHILPELKKLEHKYPNQLVVIGVHSAKFDTEKVSSNIAEAVLRYEIEHPVVNDHEHAIWNRFGVRSWPTIALIDPEGKFLGRHSGEFKAEMIDGILTDAIPFYKKAGLMDEKPLEFERLAAKQKPTPLRFPSKVLADEKSGRLFITDSNHHRIVVTSLTGELQQIIGSGAKGAADGDFSKASFNLPQGLALHEDKLYVADTENHLIRKIDLTTKKVITIAGIGSQAESAWPGLEDTRFGAEMPERFVGPPAKTAISSPWAVWVNESNLYIAMAGPHQIWKMPLDESEIGPYAGNGREDIVDGIRLPNEPYQARVLRGDTTVPVSSFAQPSGLSGDGEYLYVADSEGSSIRAVPFDPSKAVTTVVGTNTLPGGRLFEFGLADGDFSDAQFQHALGVVYHNEKIYVADTYNNAIREIDLASKQVSTLAGKREKRGEAWVGLPGASNEEGSFDEPAGITYADGKLFIADTNNHLIRVYELTSKKLSTLEIGGLAPPKPIAAPKVPTFPDAEKVAVEPITLKPVDGRVNFEVNITLPKGWKINTLAPMQYFPQATAEAGPVNRTALGTLISVENPAATFSISLPVSGEGTDSITVSMEIYYCQDGGEGLCRTDEVQWTIPLTIANDAKTSEGKLDYTITTFP